MSVCVVDSTLELSGKPKKDWEGKKKHFKPCKKKKTQNGQNMNLALLMIPLVIIYTVTVINDINNHLKIDTNRT